MSYWCTNGNGSYYLFSGPSLYQKDEFYGLENYIIQTVCILRLDLTAELTQVGYQAKCYKERLKRYQMKDISGVNPQ